MNQTALVDKAFTYSHYAQRVARQFPTLADQVRGTPSARVPLAQWRAALSTATSQTIDAELRSMRRELMLRTLVLDLAC
ncbi:MAG TPA: hypothetical protein PKN64_10070, partial [Casimicrobium sp.]|nr:hypothetical protein [Casimicrobium sp.]